MLVSLQGIPLSAKDKEILRPLLIKHNYILSLESLWEIMDAVWDQLYEKHKTISSVFFSEFYGHPVWILNGIFSDLDLVSKRHRLIFSYYSLLVNSKYILDFGGGSGVLAKYIANMSFASAIDIYEPDPNYFFIKSIQNSQIKFISTINKSYDLIYCIDVLEHMTNPLLGVALISDSLKNKGHAVFANCFYPVIKCHLSDNFHFRYTFSIYCFCYGLIKVSALAGTHAYVFQKFDYLSNLRILIPLLNRLSRLLYLALSILLIIKNKIRRLLQCHLRR